MPGHPFAVNKAVFMDFRQSDPEVEAGSNGAFAAESGVWRVPSFLYVLPVDEDTVFVEETCLVARVQVPFDELKRRLYRRLSRMGLSVTLEDILEEEASWIPLGGTPPVAPQRIASSGAAAEACTPRRGTARQLAQARARAQAVVEGLQQREGRLGPSRTDKQLGHGYDPRRLGARLGRALGRRAPAPGWFLPVWDGAPHDDASSARAFSGRFRPPPSRAGFLSNDLSSSELLLFARVRAGELGAQGAVAPVRARARG